MISSIIINGCFYLFADAERAGWTVPRLKTIFKHDKIIVTINLHTLHEFTNSGGGMKILHTSDWHIGHSLYVKKRHDEHAKFLAWLRQQICEREIDALIVSGDVFDTGAPGGMAQKLYYDFLLSLLDTCCGTVIIVAGNHDSPRMLEAPAGVLRRLNIHVVGLPSNIDDHVIELRDKKGQTKALCCAVPYLRKNEMVRIEDDTLSSDEKIVAATRSFYNDVAQAAVSTRQTLCTGIPIIATGHLFAQGAVTHDGDGVRDLYVGNLGQVGVDVFPEEFDYVALGHIHGHQKVMGKDHIRYSGSPLCMSFSEIGKAKYVVEVNTHKGLGIEKIEVPTFQQLMAISGEYDQIMEEIEAVADDDIWLEVTYTGEEIMASLSYDIHDAVKGKSAEVLSIRNNAVLKSILKASDKAETLETMKVQDVFLKSIDSNTVSEKHREELIECFNEIVQQLEERDLCE